MKNIMKIKFESAGYKLPGIFLFLFLSLFSITLKSQNAGINSTGATPDASAMLDIVSTTSGILIPRMTHANMTSIGTPATGLSVYTTDSPTGFYYYNGSLWVPLLSNSTNNGGWSITGNSNTVPSVAAIGSVITANSNFLGTADTYDLVFGTTTGGNTYERMRVLTTGYVGIANKTPGALLDIGTAATTAGIVRLEGSTSGYVAIQTLAAAGSWSMTLPTSTGTSGQVLATNGAGVTLWQSVGAISTWGLTGNSATSATSSGITNPYANNFLGTTDNKDLVIATNSYERARVTSTGNIGISNKSPNALLDIGTAGSILGAMRLEGNTSGYVGIKASAAAGNWTMTLPTSAGTNNYVLSTDGTGITSWVTASGGAVSSVTGTAPIYVANTTTTPLISIQGTNANQGGVLYSTGSGNSAAFNATGTAPSGNVTQILVSQGTGAPTWNTVGGMVQMIYRGYADIQEGTLYNIGANQTRYLSNMYGVLNGASGPTTQYTMPKCLLTRLHVVPSSNSLTGTTTFTVYKNGSATTMTGTLAGSSSASFDITANPVSFTDGDYMDIKLVTTAGGVVLNLSKIEMTTYLLP